MPWRGNPALQDYTLFEPANTAYTLSDPTKWQPLVIEDVPPYGGGGVGVRLPCIDPRWARALLAVQGSFGAPEQMCQGAAGEVWLPVRWR